MTSLFDKNNKQNRALQKERKGYRERKGRRNCSEKACDDVVVIARAAAGLSQTDGNLASVSGTALGKHMPRESSPLNACAARTPPFGVLCQIGCSVRNDSKQTNLCFCDITSASTNVMRFRGLLALLLIEVNYRLLWTVLSDLMYEISNQ